MPTYLCHGFRWARQNIGFFVIMNDLDDAASNWIVGHKTSALIIDHLYSSFPFLPEPVAPELPAVALSDAQQPSAKPHDDDACSSSSDDDDDFPLVEWSAVKLLEEFDVAETAEASRPYAYVADYVARVDLSASVGDEMAKYENMRKAWEEPWLENLRDRLQAGADVSWYVVVCGDEERAVPEDVEDEEADDETPTESLGRSSVQGQGGHGTSQDSKRELDSSSARSQNPTRFTAQPAIRHKPSIAKSLRRLFAKKDG